MFGELPLFMTNLRCTAIAIDSVVSFHKRFYSLIMENQSSLKFTSLPAQVTRLNYILKSLPAMILKLYQGITDLSKKK